MRTEERTFTYDKTDLLKRIKDNLADHQQIVVEAREGYNEQAAEILKANLSALAQGREIDEHLHIPKPVDHIADYEGVIEMLEMTRDQNVELSMREFRQYVRDEWDWKQQFFFSNSVYSETARRIIGGQAPDRFRRMKQLGRGETLGDLQ